MTLFCPHHDFRKVTVLVGVALILPALAYAEHDYWKGFHWKGHDGKYTGERNEKGRERRVPAVPEANAAWVLVPFFGAVFLFSARHLVRGKATE
jgi:hypothetical protein